MRNIEDAGKSDFLKEVGLPIIDTMLRKAFRNWRKKRFNYETVAEVAVSRERILKNLSAFRDKYQIPIAPVLKSNAYGHGLLEVAGMLEGEVLPFLAVDSYFEALRLRNEGINQSILVLGYTPYENIASSKLAGVAFSILSLRELEYLATNLKSKQLFHLEIDTGMHRHGIPADRLGDAMRLIRANARIAVVGAFSHFADAGNPNASMTSSQISRWNEAAQIIKSELPEARFLHLAATAGSMYSERIDASAIRLGLGLYGISANPAEDLRLSPALELKTKISSLHDIGPGESVGYGATFTAEKAMRIATIPLGYFEGIDLRLSGKGTVTVRGVPCPMLGRISMNITSIDVSAIPDVAIGEDAIAISAEPAAPNSVAKITETCGTIPYEILVHIPGHLRRTVI